MATNNFKFGRTKTLGIEPKNDEKVFIKIPLENGGFWEREYFQNDLIGNVINDFKAENHVDIPKDYFMDWNCKNKSLKMTDPIRTLIVHEIPTICFNPEMKKKPLTVQDNDIIPQAVGKPFNNPFEIFIFKKSDKILKTKTYEENEINSVGLNEYDSSSAYCNGNNKLFISGGENKYNEIINKLWIIDLEGNFLNGPYAIPPKKNHSMIFIPPGYVFFVGGNDKKTFYFDNESQEIYEWADLNKERYEPALQRIGNTLYCFDNLHKSNDGQLSFEKTNLESINPEWDLFYPQIDPNLPIEKLPQKFFGVSKDSDNSIIFLGGSMDNYTDRNTLTNYKYNPNNNSIEVSNVPYRDYNFKEKTFLPYNKNIDYILPDFNKQHPEVVFYVKNKSKVEKVNYRPNIKSEQKFRAGKKYKLDPKYDFNMPTISIPEPTNGPTIENFNINKYEQVKMAKPKEIVIKRYSIREPSFQEYDVNLNYKIEQPPPFKEPEIEPNKGDQRLSIEIPVDLIKKENEKMGVNVNVDLNEEKKNDLKNKVKENLRYIPKMPKVQSQRQLFTKNYPAKKEYIIPKFHSSVDDPGNELIITSKGKLYSSYIPKEPIKVKKKREDLNIKSERSEILMLPNFYGSVNMLSDRNISPNVGDINVNEDIKADFKTPNIKMPISQSININSSDYKLTGNIPGLKGPKINMPSGNINVKGPDSNYELTGFLPGTKYKVSTPEYNLKGPSLKMSGNIPNANLNNPNIDIKSPDVKVSGLKINSPDFDLNGKIPGVKVNAPNIDLKGPNVDLKGPEYNLKGSMQGIEINPPKIDMPSGDVKLRGTKISAPDYNLVGNIPGVKVNAPKIEIPKGKINLNNSNCNLTGLIPGKKLRSSSSQLNIKGPTYNINKNGNLSGLIPGSKSYRSKINLKAPNINGSNYNFSGTIPGINVSGKKLNSPNIKIQNPKIEGPDFNLKGDIPGKKVNVPNVEINAPKVNLKGPDYNLNGNIPGINISGNKLNSPNINIQGPKIEGPDLNLKGDVPGMKVNAPNVEINAPKVDLKGPNIEGTDLNLKGDIPGMKVNVPNVEINAPKVDLKGPKIESPDFNLKGDIPGMKVNAPNVEINGPKVNLKGPDYNVNGNIPGIKANAPKLKIPNRAANFKTGNYSLEGNIPGLKGNKSDFFISGLIPSYRERNPNLEIKNYKITQPNIKVTNIEPNFNIKNSHNSKLKSSKISRGGSQGKGNFHGSINDPNYSDFKDLKGSRRLLFCSQDKDLEIPRNTSPKKLIVSSIKIIDEKDVDLENPYNINNMAYLQGKQNDQNRKNINMVVNKLEIQPEQNNNEIKLPDNNFKINVPDIKIREGDFDINKNLKVNPNEINLNVENNNNLNLGDVNIKMDNKNIDIDNIGIKSDKIELENDKNISIKMPKVEIKNDLEIKPELPNIEIEQPKLESNINVNKKDLTDLRFRPIININNENNLSNSGNNEENSSRIISGNIKKKGKGLPMVGIKSNNFQSSKIDVAGKLDVNNLDVNNMKSANVGVNGVKLGERIIE